LIVTDLTFGAYLAVEISLGSAAIASAIRRSDSDRGLWRSHREAA
jgi:hypothetical protein